MEATTIKWIDRRIGTVACRVFSFYNRFIPNSKIDRPTKKILFIKLIEQGASVLAYSALKEAIGKVGRENVYFLVFEENKPILSFLNILKAENIIVIRNGNFRTFLIDSIKALYFIRKRKIDSCIDMEFFSRASAIIAFLSGAKKRVGLFSFTSEHPYRGSLITHKIHYNPYVHVSQYYLMLVRALEEKAVNEPLLKMPVDDFKTINPRIEIEEQHIKRIKQLLGSENLTRTLIILNPNASDMLPLRKWETEKFKRLALLIQEKYDNSLIVFTGIEKERPAIENLMNSLSGSSCINLAGKTNLQELMALYQLSSLVITNDSGPAHFASMFDTSIIVLFGPETPQLFAPLGKNIQVVYKNLACSPCVNVFNHRFSPCTNNICMQKITVEEVFTKVTKVL